MQRSREDEDKILTFFVIFSFTYFFSTNKDVYKIIGLSKEKFEKKRLSKPINKLVEKDVNWKIDNAPDDNTGAWHVSFYFSKPFKLKPARDFAHYPMKAIQKTLSQNHNNAAFYSLLIVLFVLLIGIFKENTYFIIPAAASITLFFSLMILVAAAVYSFLKEWTFIFFATEDTGLAENGSTSGGNVPVLTLELKPLTCTAGPGIVPRRL